MSGLFSELQAAAAELNLQLDALQRVRMLMHACQVRHLPVGGRRFHWNPDCLTVLGSQAEGMLVIADHPIAPGQDVRTCRGCACTDLQACVSADGTCSWRVLYGDGTGLCSRCDDTGPQPSLFSSHHAGQQAG
ncbi:hypothetical protein [Hydrocarboniphaga sp.]|uniref:hypothetical protein n=1 Tax=Hydrocarboniphaga sp. TaxID=2033016 RepID=UPI003D10D5F6